MLVETSKDFFSSLNFLAKCGGAAKKKSDECWALLSKAREDYQNAFAGIAVTNNGESRINHCVKYDLGNGYRLVTIHSNKILLFCFAGNHANTDKWLDRNKGLVVSCNKKNNIETYNNPDLIVNDGEAYSIRLQGKLADQLSEEHKDSIGSFVGKMSIMIKILGLEFSSSDNKIKSICDELKDDNLAKSLFNIMSSIKHGDTENAIKLVGALASNSKNIEDMSDAEIIKIKDGDTIKSISYSSSEYQDYIKRLIDSEHYEDWMLFMHPDQEEIIKHNFSGPALLSGVSGSGKTCIVVHRAIRMARETKDKVLVITLNEGLATLISDLLDYACPDKGIRSLIESKPFSKLCKDLLLEFDSELERYIEFITWKSNDHIDEIWREFYRCEVNNEDARVLFELHKMLLARSINAENYIRDEFDWVRSISSVTSPQDYYNSPREGRSEVLQQKYRASIISGLIAWNNKMADVGVTDYLNLATLLHDEYLTKIKQQYKHVLIDEAQDFGTIELKIIRAITCPGENDLFFTGDIMQTILPKHHSYRSAGINISGRSKKLKKNYRNSKEILTTAYDILYNSIADCEYITNDKDFEILDPSYANFHSNQPVLLRADSLADEIAYTFDFIQNESSNVADGKFCICFAGYSMLELSKFAELHKLPVLDGTKHISDANIFISDLEQMKGFEFDTVLILNCSANVIPNPLLPNEENFRDICRLYVAMTRAKKTLVLSHSGNYSSIFQQTIENSLLYSEDWNMYYETPFQTFDTPKHIQQFVNSSEETDFGGLTGRQFLYTDYAIGISRDLANKLEELVTGSAQSRGGTHLRVKWKDIRSALADVKRFPHAKQLFGSKVHLEFLNFFENIVS